MFWLLVFYGFVRTLFRTLKKVGDLIEQDVSLYVQTFQVVPTKTILPFLQKGEKTAELVFCF